MARLVIKAHRPWQTTLAIVILSAVISGLTWLLLDSSHWQAIHDRLGGNSTSKHLIERNTALQEENRHLQENILMLEQTTRVDRETAALLQGELKGLQDEVYRLKRELEFYHGVMDTTSKVSGPDVQGIYVEPLSRPNQYQIKLVLTNVATNDKAVEGSLDIRFEGMQDDAKVRLDLAAVSLDENPGLVFEMKSFKRVDFRFEMPAGYQPERILVDLSLKDRKDPPVNRVFDWPLP